VRERLLEHVCSSRRVFLGFDFAYGYPEGFADAIGLTGPEHHWIQIWRELTRLIEDWPDNSNNRFEVASELNSRCVASIPGPLWGCPKAKRTVSLLPTSSIYPFETSSGMSLRRFRLTEGQLPGVKSVWQLLGAGSVGSQTLLGIPAVCQLRDTPKLRSISKVWPFETGFVPNPTPSNGPFVLHAEIWPGVVKGKLDPGLKVPDQAQVRAMVEWLHELDTSNNLAPLFDKPSSLREDDLPRCLEHEGWIFGAR
jgi:hypothetical protein